jgi:hypothetical protein
MNAIEEHNKLIQSQLNRTVEDNNILRIDFENYVDEANKKFDSNKEEIQKLKEQRKHCIRILI